MSKDELLGYLNCYQPLPAHITLALVQLTLDSLSGSISSSIDNVTNESSANFGIFFYHHLFPDLKRALYLDVGLTVKGNIADLWRQLCGSQLLLLAAPARSGCMSLGQGGGGGESQINI